MKSSRGMSLTEVAIVLGIVGVVIGGIWMVAASTRQGMQANQLHQQTLVLIKQVRDYYAGRALPSAAIASGTFTTTLRTGGIFPEDMCPANCVSGGITTVYNVYGGTATAAIPTGTNPINEVDITYTNVGERGCIQLAMMLSGRSAEVGLISYDAGTARTSFPIPLSTINGDCTDGDTVTIAFKIRN